MGYRFTATNSETSTFRNCPKRWGFEYLDRLRPISSSAPLRIGRVFHEIIAEFYKIVFRNNINLDNYNNHETLRNHLELHNYKNKLNSFGDYDDEELIDSMIETHIRCVVESFQNFSVVLVEEPFEIPVRNRMGRASHLYHKGVLDLVLYDRRWNDLVLVEHKTTGSDPIEFEKRVEFDPQIGGYLYALRELIRQGRVNCPVVNGAFGEGIKTGRVIYNVSKRKLPSRPRVLSSGKVSEARIDTLPEIYQEAMVEQNLRGISPTEKQQNILTILRDRGTSSFFARYEFFRSDESIEQWRNDQVVTSRQMRQAKKDSSYLVRNPSCTQVWMPRCPYRELCIDDSPDIRKMMYRVAEDPHEEVVLAQDRKE